ncbi:MAG: hypothetical protein O3B01_04315 [Planctomycetota bacterium]|nr:hypothetical protein [Planctomycetota bacterium]
MKKVRMSNGEREVLALYEELGKLSFGYEGRQKCGRIADCRANSEAEK